MRISTARIALESLTEITVRHVAPYHGGSTSSRQITEVKHRRAETVLGWGTAWEPSVRYTVFTALLHFFCLQSFSSPHRLTSIQDCFNDKSLLEGAVTHFRRAAKKDKVRKKDRSLSVSDKSLNKGLISEDRNARLLCFLQYPVLVQVVCMGFISGGKRF